MKHKSPIITIGIILISLFGAADFASAGWTTGKYNSAIDFNGTTYIDGFGAIGNINSVSFWIKADNLTNYMIDINGTQTITVSAGTISANNFTSPTIYVDGKISSILPDTNWHHITITTATNISASAVVIGKVSTNYFDGTLDEVRFYNYARAADEIRLDYQAGYAIYLGPSGKTCSEDPASCMDYGLAGYWSMDEGGGQTAKDLSGNGNNGTLGATATAGADDPVWTKGKNGGALKFDGVNDYVDTVTTTAFDFERTQAFSLGSWIKSNYDPSSNAMIISNRQITTYAGFTLYIDGADGGNPLGFALVNSDTSEYLWKKDSTGFNLLDDQWHYVFITYDGSSDESGVRMYIDGVLKSTTDASISSPIGGTVKSGISLKIGREGSDTNYFNGSIDEVRIYNYVRSAEQIQMDYQQGAATHLK